MISVREAKALPKTNSQQWKNKYICVEGMPFLLCLTSYIHLNFANDTYLKEVYLNPLEPRLIFPSRKNNVGYTTDQVDHMEHISDVYTF